MREPDFITQTLILWAVYALLVLSGLHFGSKFIESVVKQSRAPIVNTKNVRL